VEALTPPSSTSALDGGEWSSAPVALPTVFIR
jgi:hypothetical protein